MPAVSLRVELCDKSGVTLQILDGIARQLAHGPRMGLPAALTFVVPANHPKVADTWTAAAGGDDLPYLCEGRRLIRLWRNNTLIFAGKVWTINDSGDPGEQAPESAVVCYDALKPLEHRACRTETSPELTSTTERVSFPTMDGGHIARWLVAVTNQEKGHCGLEPGFTTFREAVVNLGASHGWRIHETSPPVRDQVGSINLNKYPAIGGVPTIVYPGALVGDPDIGQATDGASIFVQSAAGAGATNSDTFTILMFLKPTDFAVLRTVYDGGPSGPRIQINTAGQIVVSKDAPSGGAMATTAGQGLSAGAWRMVTWTKAAGTSKLYINGTDVTPSFTNRTFGATGGVSLAAPNGGGFEMWYGGIDEVWVWDGVALDADTVGGLYTISTGAADTSYGNVFELSQDREGVIFEQRMIASALYELATAYNGFDFRVVPLNRTDGRYGRLDILAMLGTDRPGALFDWRTRTSNVRTVQRSLDMGQVANDITGIGTPGLFGGPPPTSHQTDPVSISAFGVMEDFDSFPDISNQTYLDDLVEEELSFRNDAREIVQVVPIPGISPVAYGDDYDLGDVVQLAVSADLRGGLSGEQRVYGWDAVWSDEHLETIVTLYVVQP